MRLVVSMTFNPYIPAPALRPYIERYWLLSGYMRQKEVITLMPDGGINLVLNLGEDVSSLGFGKNIRHEHTYMVGVMMRTEEQVLQGKVLLFGIIFRPGAFTHFYKFDTLDRYANQFQEFDQKDFPDVKKTIRYFLPYIDQFYLDRLSPPRYSLLNIVSDIKNQSGILKIDALAKKHFTTERHLERQFQQQIGVSPKEFINLTRFNNAFASFQSGRKQTFSDIAWEFGYYDPAHFTMILSDTPEKRRRLLFCRIFPSRLQVPVCKFALTKQSNLCTRNRFWPHSLGQLPLLF